MKKSIKIDLSETPVKNVFIQIHKKSSQTDSGLEYQDGPLFITANHINVLKPYLNDIGLNTYVLIDASFQGLNELKKVKRENFDYTVYDGELPNVVCSDEVLHLSNLGIKTTNTNDVDAFRELFKYMYITSKQKTTTIEYDALRPVSNKITFYDNEDTLLNDFKSKTHISGKKLDVKKQLFTRMDLAEQSKDQIIDLDYHEPLTILDSKSTTVTFQGETPVAFTMTTPFDQTNHDIYEYHAKVKTMDLLGKSAITQDKKPVSIKKTIKPDPIQEKVDLLTLDNEKALDKIVKKHHEKLQKQYSGKALALETAIHFNVKTLSDIKGKLTPVDDEVLLEYHDDLKGVKAYQTKGNKKEIILVAKSLNDNIKSIKGLAQVVLP